MTQTRFTCTLIRADEPVCQSYARVTIIDAQGDSGRACPRHAMAALDGISRARERADTSGCPVVLLDDDPDQRSYDR